MSMFSVVKSNAKHGRRFGFAEFQTLEEKQSRQKRKRAQMIMWSFVRSAFDKFSETFLLSLPRLSTSIRQISN